MKKFLERINLLIDLSRLDGYDVDNEEINNLYEISKLRREFNSLGKNAKQMLEIGIVQDELVKLGFEHICESSSLACLIHQESGHTVNFWTKYVKFGASSNNKFFYISLNWQNDLINKIKELIK